MRHAHTILVGNPQVMTQFGRPELRWEANIKMDTTEMGEKSVDGIMLAQGTTQWQAAPIGNSTYRQNYSVPYKQGNLFHQLRNYHL
jgi:hypothetical protein